MTHPAPIQFAGEEHSNAVRATLTEHEPQALRTFTPSQAVLSRSSGVFHWTADGRRLYDYSSGVLVANLGHNPCRWMYRLVDYMGWTSEQWRSDRGYFEGVALTAYNAMTPLEAMAVDRLLKNLRSWPGGKRLESVMWAASGSEAVQKALWACLHRDEKRDLILATRYGFHGKKGLAGAVTGSETDRDRDPRVKFISFPMQEVDDVSVYGRQIDLAPYARELEQLWAEYGQRLNCLITEPYLGGGGSFHPPAEYLQLLERFCRQHDILFILDEVQANFGRTGKMFAFEKYGLEPDFVVLGKGLGNGIPVSAAVGRRDIMESLKYGEASDTWSANPLSCAAVLATLDEFETTDVLANTAKLSEIFLAGLARLKETGLITKLRGEGMVFGIECAPCGALSDREVAVELVRDCYLGENGEGIHLLGALAGKVLRVSPPMTMTAEEAHASLDLMYRLFSKTAERLQGKAVAAAR
ncbi:MAG TPA: aspartate aminotransferase family protein [Planctomycetaceae bacterium]|nr:aspartate aminotransferase family protein [Planctomycetaceae bacterium]